MRLNSILNRFQLHHGFVPGGESPFLSRTASEWLFVDSRAELGVYRNFPVGLAVCALAVKFFLIIKQSRPRSLLL